jgi:thioredoxin 2
MTMMTACPACATGNKVGEGALNAAKCGKCGAKLFTGAPLDVDDAGLAAQLKFSSAPVLIDVWAPWCAPCRMMAPHFAEAARQFEPRVRFVKLNADRSETSAQLGVRGIPALILFHEGREVARHAGMPTASQLIAWIDRSLGSITTLETQS